MRCPDMPGEATISLRILETTDLHGHVHGYDYFADRPCPATGFARIATLIERARDEADNVLLFDNGDFLQGTPLAQYWGTERGIAPDEVHPMIAAMNLAGYDAAALGNHEFDYGLDYLRMVMSGAGFPFLCANLTVIAPEVTEPERHFVRPWTVLERAFTDKAGRAHRLRIGVIGVLPPQTIIWAGHALDGRARTQGILAAMREQLKELRAQQVDLVIVLAHTGIAAPVAPPLPEAQLEHAALEIAALDGVDIILCGHTHECFPARDFPASPGIDPFRGALHGKPAISAGRWGSHLGVLDLRLERDDEQHWKITEFQPELRPIREGGPATAPGAPLPEAPGVLLCVAPAHAETLTHIRRPLGTLTIPIQSYFSLVAPDAGLTLVADAQRTHVRAQLAGTAHADLPILTAVSPFKSGGRGGPDYYIDIAPGPILLSHIDDLYPYPNLCTALVVTGADLRDWLEHAAGAFATIRPGTGDQPLFDPAFPSYNFDVIDGLTYEIDPTAPPRFQPDGRLRDEAAWRIRDLRHGGVPVRDRDRFVLATNSYRSAGAGRFIDGMHPPVDLGPPRLSRDVLIDEVTRRERIAIMPQRIWRFRSIPGTAAQFGTSPRAIAHLNQASGVDLEPLDLQEDGFQQIRLRFPD